MNLARAQRIEIPAEALVSITRLATSPVELKISALRSLSSQKHPELESLLTTSLKDIETEVRITALELLASNNASLALDYTKSLLKKPGGSHAEKQAAIDLLATTLASEAGDALFEKSTRSIRQSPLSPPTQSGRSCDET